VWRERRPQSRVRPARGEWLKILLAEDVAMIRGALVALIELESDLRVVAEVDQVEEILPVALRCQPDVVIIDIDRLWLDGLAAAAKLRERVPCCRTLILTSLGRPGVIGVLLAAEVAGFIVKDAPAGHLAPAIRNVAAGHRMVGPALAVATWESDSLPLSRREHSVLRLVGDGAEPAEIAAVLHLSVGTVRNYLTAIVAKLHARNRVDAVRKAYNAGLLP
jgi:two-component system, NarL family, response regulator DesR